MGTWDDSLSPCQPLAGARLVEGGRLGVKLHVTRIDSWPIDPGVVQVAFTRLDEEHLEVVVQVGQPGEVSELSYIYKLIIQMLTFQRQRSRSSPHHIQ